MRKKVIVIGAGAGGLAAGIRLQYEGYDVEIYEKEQTPGGKMNRIEMDGYSFDSGPTIVMMPELYRELFNYCGRNPHDYIPMQKVDPMYQVYFQNDLSSPLTVSNDLVEWTEILESLSPTDAAGFFTYLHDLHEGFTVAREQILQRPFRRQRDFYTWTMLKKGLKMKAGRNASKFMDKYLKDEKLKQAIRFQTLYIGISPLESPSFYTMIPAIQFIYGVWFIRGGMYTMTKAMEKLFLELGGKIHYKNPAEEILIEQKKAIGIRTKEAVEYADYVLCNADFPYAMKNLIQDTPSKGKYHDQKISRMSYSCSCFVLYLGMNRKYTNVAPLHTFVFSRDFDENMRAIFAGKKLSDPSFYVYIASKLDPSLAPEGKDGLYVMMPVSNLKDATYEWNDRTVLHYRKKLLDALSKIKGFETVNEDIVSETHFTPKEFESVYHAHYGAVFGLMPNLMQSGHFRPQSKSSSCSNLYFTGGSTHPGAGIPMVLLSARIAAQELMQDDRGIEFHYD